MYSTVVCIQEILFSIIQDDVKTHSLKTKGLRAHDDIQDRESETQGQYSLTKISKDHIKFEQKLSTFIRFLDQLRLVFRNI